jgi:hypothetical protein
VARKKNFLGAEFSDRFRESYAGLSHDRQKETDKVILALMKQDVTPGMRIKPIQPEKYYNEARLNSGDRLVHRVEGGKVWLVDVVPHDDIGRYGRELQGLFSVSGKK